MLCELALVSFKVVTTYISYCSIILKQVKKRSIFKLVNGFSLFACLAICHALSSLGHRTFKSFWKSFLLFINNNPPCPLLFVKDTIPTGRPLTAPGMSRICVSCFKGMGTPWSSQSYSRWSTGRCPWGVLGTLTTGMPSGRSKFPALLQCSPRNSTYDRNSNGVRPQSYN